MEETKKKLYVERDGFWTEAAMLLMALAMVFRLIGSIGRWDDMHYMTTQVALPIAGGLLFLLCLLFFGKRAFWTTVIPVVMGIVFFIFRIMGLDSEWMKVGWIAIYLVIVVLYAMSFSHPGLKWVLALALLLLLAYHIGILDLPRLMDLKNPVSFLDGMEEMSILGTILSMLFVSFAMRTEPKSARKTEPAEQTPAEPEELPEEPEEKEEKKLSRWERRRQERREKKEKQESKPEPAPAALSEEPVAPGPEPSAEPEEPAWLPEEMPEEPVLPEEAPEEPVLPEETPEEPVLPEDAPIEEQPTDDVPVQELDAPTEPAQAYPVELIPDEVRENGSSPEDKPETL